MDNGAPLSGTGSRPSDRASDESRPAGFDPSRRKLTPGAWVIVAGGRWGWNLHGERFVVAQVERVTAKKVFTVRPVHSRHSHDKHLVSVCASEADAKQLTQSLDGLRGELERRVTAARLAYQSALTSAIEAAAAGESATGEAGDAQPQGGPSNGR